jgi:hypothetical protein
MGCARDRGSKAPTVEQSPYEGESRRRASDDRHEFHTSKTRKEMEKRSRTRTAESEETPRRRGEVVVDSGLAVDGVEFAHPVRPPAGCF